MCTHDIQYAYDIYACVHILIYMFVCTPGGVATVCNVCILIMHVCTYHTYMNVCVPHTCNVNSESTSTVKIVCHSTDTDDTIIELGRVSGRLLYVRINCYFVRSTYVLYGAYFCHVFFVYLFICSVIVIVF